MRSLLVILLCSLSAAAFAQNSTSVEGRVLIRITDAYAAKTAAVFAPLVDNPDFRDPQKLVLFDEDSIRSLFILPREIHDLRFKPLTPQHSIALPELRRRTNPQVFLHELSAGRINDDREQLRRAEAKLSRWFELLYSGDITPEQIASVLRKSAAVDIAEPRRHRWLQFIPNDPLFKDQYAPQLMKAPEAWDIVRADSSVLVAVIDNGTDWRHPDLIDAIFINTGETGVDEDGYDKRSNGIDDDGNGFIDDWHGWDFGGAIGISPDNNTVSLADHGTHTAGIIAASGNNNIGIAGIAYGAKLLPLKASSDYGGTIDFGYEAMVYAADRGASVINNSWGGTTRSAAEEDIIEYVTAKNSAVVAASGNAGIFQNLYPAAYPNVLSVGAVDPSGNVASYTTYGMFVDVTAPGTQVYSTVNNNRYSWSTGTSMASPNAAGALALVRKKYPSYSPQQAIERLRVTADPAPVSDSIREPFVGKGRVNIYRAVTDVKSYSSRIHHYEIYDENNNGILEPGERGDIVLHVKNYLDRLEKLQASLKVISGSDYVTLDFSTIEFGAVNTMETIQNLRGSIPIRISSDAPNNYRAAIQVTFSDPTVGYTSDRDYFTFIVNPAYIDLDANNLTVTLDSKGNIGYNNPPDNTEGSGFVWTRSPAEITPTGKSTLWLGGLMIGTDAVRLVSSTPSATGDVDQDFRIVTPIRIVTPPDHPKAVQEVMTVYADSNAGLQYEVGTMIRQRTYAFDDGLSANAVVTRYDIGKRQTASGAQPTDSTAIGLWMDWDIGLSGAMNITYQTDPRTVIVRRIQERYPAAGVRLISPLPEGAAHQFYAINNDGSDGSVSIYGGFDRMEKWITLTVPRQTAGPGDIAIVSGLKNVPLASEDSVTLVYILALGTSEDNVLQTLDKTEQVFYNTNYVRTANDTGTAFFPHPFNEILTVDRENTADDAVITLTDILGRVQFETKTDRSQIQINTSALPSGQYFLTINTNRSRRSYPVLKVK
jgi:hypothetical protein